MKQIKLEITAFIFFVCVLISASSWAEGPALVAVDVICILALCGIGFRMASAFEQAREDKEDVSKAGMQQIADEVRGVVEASEKKQEASYAQIRELIGTFAQATSEYTKRVDSLRELQEEFNSNFRDYLSEAGQNGREMASSIESSHKEIEKTAHDFCGEYLKIAESQTDEMKALKAYVNVNLEAFKEIMEQQKDEMADGLEECADQIESGLTAFIKDHKKLGENQAKELSEQVKSIETVIAQQVGKVTKENEKLLKYTQKMQEEWTTLSRNEIDFLSKVWDEA